MDRKELGARLRLWGITESEATRSLSSEQAMADFLVAADMLERRLAPERIAAVVRRPAELLGGRSLRDLAVAGEFSALRSAVDSMLDIRRVQP